MDAENIEDYTPEELLQILQIEELTRNNIIHQTNFYIEKYSTTNTNLSIFPCTVAIIAPAGGFDISCIDLGLL